MINRFKNTAHILLAVFLLLSSIGISVNKMICLSGGKTTFSFLEKKSCYPLDEDNKSTGSDAIDVHCCDFVSNYVQVDLLSVGTPIKLNVSHVLVISGFLDQLKVALTNFSTPLQINETPPLLHGVSLLKFINIFRI